MFTRFGRRKARGGRGIIPPNPAQWENEHNALDLREDLGLASDVGLMPSAAFALYPGITVLPHGEIPAAAKFIQHFRGVGSASWSGLSLRVSDDCELVLYNDSHPRSRVNATLMEEFFHVHLGHPRSTVRVLAGAEQNRSHDGGIEQAAFGSGAAALVPYAALKSMLTSGTSIPAIARHYDVSQDLVRYRMKVTKLYARRPRRATSKTSANK